MLIYRCIIAMILVFTSLFASMKGDEKPADTFDPDTLTIIEIEEKPRDAVRVASFNIRCADVNGVQVKDRRLIVSKEICDLGADSIGLQEATDEWIKQIKKIPGFGVVGEGRDGGKGEGCQILYNRSRWKLLDSGTFWLSETPDEPSMGWDAACPRICTWALLQNRLTGEKYAHVNSHFDHKGRIAVVEEAKIITAFIDENFDGIPIVFTADLNSTPDSEAYAIMTENLEDTRLTAADIKAFGTFHAAHPETHADSVIDYVLTSPGVEALAYRTVTAGVSGRFVSDHFPVYADLKF